MLSKEYLKTQQILWVKGIRNFLSQKRGTQYQKFLVLGLARSGTTLLHTYLNCHPNIFSYGEIKIENVLSSANKKPVFSQFGNHIKAVGAKVLLPPELSNKFIKDLQDLIKQEKELKLIFLHRHNLLEWFVSLKIAEKTLQWTQVRDKDSVPTHLKRIKINTEDLFTSLSKAKESVLIYRQLLDHLEFIELTYEQLNESPKLKINEVQDFLGVKPFPSFSILKKQNPESLSDLIINFQEVKQVLSESQFQDFI